MLGIRNTEGSLTMPISRDVMDSRWGSSWEVDRSSYRYLQSGSIDLPATLNHWLSPKIPGENGPDGGEAGSDRIILVPN